ncbi:MAG: hypothetical protein SVT56_01170 [Chloroflexota bacterium]|jgi:hypothetical protein|nr:hypothetical protein [Chloroflexota bacterium]
MYTLYCTSKLRKRANLPADPPVTKPTTALGNWYANLLHIGHRQILLFVSERSRLAVITPAKESYALSRHLTRYLTLQLEHLQAERTWIDTELARMDNVIYARAHNRSVLGTMNDYKYQIEVLLCNEIAIPEVKIALQLSKGPVGPLGYKSPYEVTLALLENTYAAR